MRSRSINRHGKIKKRLSAGVLFVVIIIFFVVGTVATSLITDYYRNFASFEGRYGEFGNWPTSAKVNLVVQMKENGLPINQELARDLLELSHTEEEKELLALSIVADYYGDTSHLSTQSIMQHDKGEYGGLGWTPEDMVMYNDLAKDNNLYGSHTDELPDYRIPENEQLTQEEAIKVATVAIIESFHLSASDMASFEVVHLEFFSMSTGDAPSWYLWLYSDKPISSEYTGNIYFVQLSASGVVENIKPPSMQNPLNSEFAILKDSLGLFVTWSIEQKYAFSKEWTIKTEKWYQKEKNGGVTNVQGINPYLYYLLDKDYRLPDDTDIPLETAIQAAKDTLIRKEGFSKETFSDYLIGQSFMVHDTNQLVWRIFFIPKNRDDADCGFRIDVHSKTGNCIELLHQWASDPYWGTFYE